CVRWWRPTPPPAAATVASASGSCGSCARSARGTEARRARRKTTPSCSSRSSACATRPPTASCGTSDCRLRRWCGGSRGWCGRSWEPRRAIAVRTLGLLGLVLVLLAVTAVASPGIATAAAGLGFAFKFSRVYNRVFEVVLVLAILLGWRRLDLGTATQIGLRHPRWLRDLCRGVLVGFLGLAAGVVVCWLGGAMGPALRFGVTKTRGKAIAGLLGAVVVGVGEETFFRGVLLRRFTADLGRPAGIVLSTAIYAIVHALRPGGARARYPWAGGDRTPALLAPLARPGGVPRAPGPLGLGLPPAPGRARNGG